MYYTGYGILQARILEWVAFSFSRGSSQLRDQTQVSCIAGRFFTAKSPGKPEGSHALLKEYWVTSREHLLDGKETGLG